MQGDLIQVGINFFKVLTAEPLYYEFRNLVGGVDVGFSTTIYPVSDLIPAKDKLHYITAFGILGDLKAQLRYQSGAPKNTVGARSTQRLDRIQAPYDKPFNFDFMVLAGDTLEVDIESAFAGLKGAIWFYGWKFTKKDLTEAQVENKEVIRLQDVRRVAI